MIEAIHTLRPKQQYMDPEEFRVFIIMLLVFCVLYVVMHKFFPDMDKKKRDVILYVAGAVLIAIGLSVSHG